MSVNSTNNKISTDSYLTAATGAVVSGAVVSGVNNHGLKRLADKTVQAFNSAPAECDQFVRKHNDFLNRAVEAKKGFFGKINKSLKGLTNPDEIADAVKKSSSDLIDGYRNNAARKIGSTLEGENLKKGVSELSNKYLSKDIFKSFKDVTRLQNVLMVSGAVLLGAIGACAIKEIISRKADKASQIQGKEKTSKTEPKVKDKKTKAEKAELKKDKKAATEAVKYSPNGRTTSEVNVDKNGSKKTKKEI